MEKDHMDYRAGSYPAADEANVFGELYLRFTTARAEARELDTDEAVAWVEPLFEAAFWWAYDRITGDKEFMDAYEAYSGQSYTPRDMNRILGLVKESLARQNLYGHRRIPTFGFEFTE